MIRLNGDERLRSALINKLYTQRENKNIIKVIVLLLITTLSVRNLIFYDDVHLIIYQFYDTRIANKFGNSCKQAAPRFV